MQGGTFNGRAAWLRQARAIFEEDHGPYEGPIVVEIRHPGTGLRTVTDVGGPGPVPALPPAALSPLEEQIVLALAQAGTLTGKAIAVRLHLAYDSGLRAILRNLGERRPPVLLTGRDGYRVAVHEGEKPITPQ